MLFLLLHDDIMNNNELIMLYDCLCCLLNFMSIPFCGEYELGLADLALVQQEHEELVNDYIRRFWDTRKTMLSDPCRRQRASRAGF